MKIGDTVRVKDGHPFAGFCGQVYAHLVGDVWDIAFESVLKGFSVGRSGLVPFREEQLEQVKGSSKEE